MTSAAPAQLFPQVATRDPSFARASESRFEFLSRSSWPRMTRARAEMERWASKIAEPTREDLARRFRSTRDDQHTSAFLELWTHEVLTQRADEVQPHPPVPGTTHHPDFLATHDGTNLYVECTVSHRSPTEKRLDRFSAELVEALNEAISGDISVSVDWVKEPQAQESFIKLAKQIADWARGLDVVVMGHRQHRVWTEREMFSRGDAKVRIGVMNVSDPSRLGPDRPPVGSPPGKSRWGNAVVKQSIARALRAKGTRYGEPSGPYVIVLGCDDAFAQLADCAEVLLGITAESGGISDQTAFWHHRGEPRNTRVSAVLFLPAEPNAWTAMGRERSWGLFHNPWASHPLNLATFPFARTIRLTDERLEFAEPTTSVAGVLGLPDDWPGLDR